VTMSTSIACLRYERHSLQSPVKTPLPVMLDPLVVLLIPLQTIFPLRALRVLPLRLLHSPRQLPLPLSLVHHLSRQCQALRLRLFCLR
jgi:hypothetical protein